MWKTLAQVLGLVASLRTLLLATPLAIGKAARAFLLMLAVLAGTASSLHATDVWVDFVSDFHDGANGPSNGVADWIDELNEAATSAGVGIFSSTERALLESRILTDLRTLYADYDLTFVTSEPTGDHDVIYMARDTDHPSVSSSNLGSSPLDLGNTDTRGYSIFTGGSPLGVPKVTTGNFDRFLEGFDSRGRQIAELSRALAGTAAHEYGHSVGLLHHFAYSAVGITPANYSNTGSLQNAHLMATGSTGISETQRESLRSLSPFSKVMLDISGGSEGGISDDNDSLIAGGGILSDRTENNGSDAGATLATAQALSFETGHSSKLEISFVEADLDGSSSDVDLFRLTANVGATLTAHVFSTRLSSPFEFDPVLELLDATGSSLALVDDIGWDDNQYNDLISPEATENDPFLLNIPLTPGEYYLRVSAATTDIFNEPNVGDNYWLVTSLDRVPEPSSLLLVLLALLTPKGRLRSNRNIPSSAFPLPPTKRAISTRVAV